MRRITTFILVFLMLLAIVGCKKTPEADMYENPSVEEVAEAVTETEATQEENSAVVLEVDADNVATEDGAETVSEDVYDNDESAVEEVDPGTVVVVEPTSIDDPEFQDSLLKYFDPIYYNRFFRLGDYVDGITEEDMIKFAISYVYQYEYNEMKFDTTDFILYVPEKRVEEMVERYFDYEVTGHHSFIEENLQYQDGYYLVPAVVLNQEDTLRIVAVTATGDFSYDVIMPMPMVDEDDNGYYRASIEVRNDRYILVGYVKQTMDEAQVSEEDSIEPKVDDVEVDVEGTSTE